LDDWQICWIIYQPNQNDFRRTYGRYFEYRLSEQDNIKPQIDEKIKEIVSEVLKRNE
jgi:hypothetical protein